MTPAERAKKLNEARELVKAVLFDLNVRQETCNACKHKVYAIWDEAQAYEQLMGVANKLNKWSLNLGREKRHE